MPANVESMFYVRVATHAEPLRKSATYRENMFARTIEGNPLIDKAYEIIREAA